MPQQQAPWIEGKYGWNFGEGGWNTGMDQNLLKFSFMFDRNVDSITASLPPAVNGQAHYLTTDNRLYFAVGTTYFSCPTPKWFEFVVRGTGVTYQFNGTSAVQVESLVGIDNRLDAIELSVASLGTASSKDIEFFATTSRVDVVEANAQSTTDRAVQVIGEYAAGLVLRNRNQGFRYLEDIYLPTVSTVLPYTTTGAGASEIANFRSVGDAVLRQDLASSSPGNGSALIAKGGQVVTSIAELRLLLKTSASVNAFVTGYYAAGDGGGGAYYYDATDTTTANNGGTVIVAADGGRWKLSHRGTVSARQFGAKGDGVTDDTPSFAGAVQSGCLDVVVDGGTFMLSELAIPAGVTLRGTSHRSSILKKRLNGTVVSSLGRHSKLLNLKIDGGSSAYATGNSVEISVGDNDPVYLNQGHQLIENCWFANSHGYHVAYTAANKGYQSKISRCIFDEPLSGLAAILWPDEPQNGGNRYVQTCYSSGPLVNLNGCDNGHITECIVGAGIKGGEQGILMPNGTVNSAKKAFIADNRFAVADLPMVFRGSSHVVTGNSFAATVTLPSAFTGSIFADNLTTQPIVDSLVDTSGTRVYHSQAVTPNFRSAGGGALIGNAVVSGLIEWKGLSKYYSGKFKFGSTTNFGAGHFITDLVGAVSGSFGFSGDWQCLDLNTGVQWDGSIFCPPGGSNSMAFADRGNTVNATYPFTWASGDELHWEAKVR